MSDIIEHGMNDETLDRWDHWEELEEQWFDDSDIIPELERERLEEKYKNKVTKKNKNSIEVLDEELRIKPTDSSVSSENIELAGAPFRRDVGTIKVQVPTLTFNEKAVSKWTRLGRRKYLQGGEVEVQEELPTLSDEELNNLLGIVTEKESLPEEKQSAWKEITKGIRASAKGIGKGISSLLEKNKELTEEQLDYLRTLKNNVP